VPPLGYEARDRKLVLIPEEAETVCHIFRRYVALGSVRVLKDELEGQAVTSKIWTSASGRSRAGKQLTRGALYLMFATGSTAARSSTRTRPIPASTPQSSIRVCGMRSRPGSPPTRSSAAQVSG
jgi:hypothetical protein